MASSMPNNEDDSSQAQGEVVNMEGLREATPVTFPPPLRCHLNANARQFFPSMNGLLNGPTCAWNTRPNWRHSAGSSLPDPSFLQSFWVNCSGCQQANKASAMCYQCRKFLCKKCLDEHLRIRETSFHTIYHFDTLTDRLPPNNLRACAQNAQLEQRPSSANVGSTSGSNGRTVDHHQTRVQPSTSRAVGAERRSTSEGGGSTETISLSIDDMSLPESSNFGSFSGSIASSLTSSTDSNIYKNILTAAQVNLLGELQVDPPCELGPVEKVAGEPAQNPRASSAGEATKDLQSSPSEVCPLHHAKFNLVCSECFEFLCPTCADEKHADHRVVYFSLHRNSLAECTQELLKQIQSLNGHLKHVSYNLNRTHRDIDYFTQQACMDIKRTFERMLNTIQKKREEFLQKVEQIRQVKFSNTTLQMENIRKTSSYLADAAAKLTNHNGFANSWEHAAANLQASKTLHELRNLGDFKALENGHIMFVGPQESILQHATMWGQLRVNIPPREEALLLLQKPMTDISRRWPELQNLLHWSISREIFGRENFLTVKQHCETPSRIMGIAGDGPGEFCRPWGITINPMGQIIVADRSNSRIQVFDPEGNFLFHFGTHGSEHGQFNRPAGIAVGPSNDLVVCDKDNHRVQVFSCHGEFMHTFGERGSKIGQFLYPWDVACDSHGNILVSDSRNHRIQLFSWNGVFLDKFGGEVARPRLFDSPRGVTFDPKGNILVTDFNTHRVVIIHRITRKVRYIGQIGADDGYFNRPQGIACDDRGWFVVTDTKNSRIQVFNNNGDFMWSIGYSCEFRQPSDVAIDPDGHIYVIDFGENRIQIF